MPLPCLEREIKDGVSHNFTEEEESESTTDMNDLHWDASHCEVSSLSELSCCDTETDLAVSRSISNHISSTVLNLKVSQVLLQEAERSLDNAEAVQVNVPCFDEVDAGKFEDVLGRQIKEKESSDGAQTALGPPSRNYIPKWNVDEDVEESQYSSAQEDSFDSGSYARSLKVCMHNHKYHENSKHCFVCLWFIVYEPPELCDHLVGNKMAIFKLVTNIRYYTDTCSTFK